MSSFVCALSGSRLTCVPWFKVKETIISLWWRSIPILEPSVRHCCGYNHGSCDVSLTQQQKGREKREERREKREKREERREKREERREKREERREKREERREKREERREKRGERREEESREKAQWHTSSLTFPHTLQHFLFFPHLVIL